LTQMVSGYFRIFARGLFRIAIVNWYYLKVGGKR
jgi:hypothetical protein